MTRRHVALAAGVLFAFLVPAAARAQTPKLLWSGDGTPIVDGYRVTIDGVTTDHGLAPLSSGSCSCSITLSLNGGVHTIFVTAYNSFGQASSAPLTVAPSANAGGPYTAQAGTLVV